VSFNQPNGTNLVVDTTDGGASWTNPTQPDGVTQLADVSCGSALDCMAVGPGVITSSDGGASWTERTIPSGGGVVGVSCSSGADCVAVGAATIATTDGGATWVSQGVPTQFPFNGLGVSCASALDCVVVGFQVEGKFGPFPPTIAATTDGGATWSTQSVPDGVGVLDQVSCPSSTDCVALSNGSDGPAAVATTDGGATWSIQTLPSAVDTVAGISCATPSNCMAVGETSTSSGVAMATTDGGANWTVESVPSGPALTGVSCASTTDCVAVGGGMILGTTNPFDLKATTTTASVDPAQVVTGLPVSYSTSVAATAGSGTPTGIVTFGIGSTHLCTVTLSGGGGTCTSSAAPIGLDRVVASYGGDPNFAASSGTTSLNVQAFGITTTSLSAGAVGVPYQNQLTAAGGTAPYRWKKTAALPSGLKLSSSGVISGTPNVRKVPPGSYPVSVQVSDSTKRHKQIATATFTLTLS
jgi:hypothetical protein